MKVFWKSKEVGPLPQEVLEILDDERAVEVQPEDDVREIIKDVMEFLSGGTVSPITNTLKRDGVYLCVHQESTDDIVVDLATKESNDNSILHVHLSEQEQAVLKSFYFKAREEILEREKRKKSEEALEIINNIMLQAKNNREAECTNIVVQ